MIRRFIAIATFLASAVAVHAFEGNYDVSGHDPYEKMDYTGSLTIKKDKNNVYQAKWDLIEGGKRYKYDGTGLPVGQDSIAFTFLSVKPTAPEQGLQIYMRNEDQSLNGPYVIFDKNLVGSETATSK